MALFIFDQSMEKSRRYIVSGEKPLIGLEEHSIADLCLSGVTTASVVVVVVFVDDGQHPLRYHR